MGPYVAQSNVQVTLANAKRKRRRNCLPSARLLPWRTACRPIHVILHDRYQYYNGYTHATISIAAECI